MAKLVYGLNQSFDGSVDHAAFEPGPTLFRHFIEHARRQSGSLCGRMVYELKHSLDVDQPAWGERWLDATVRLAVLGEHFQVGAGADHVVGQGRYDATRITALATL